MNKMANPRELTSVEKFYIQNNLDKSDSEISSQMKGVGPKTVEKYRQEISEKKQENKNDTDHTEETQKERVDRLGNGPKAGEFISRREGVAIMTQQASEVTDARKIVRGQTSMSEELEGKNKDKIHRPKG